MRIFLLLSTTTLLAACGGGDTQTIGSTPTPPGGPATTHSFAKPTEAKTYVGIGGHHVYEYSTDDRECCDQQQQVYAGNATTVRNSGVSIAYDPRDAIYTLTVADELTGAATRTRFQDPGSRTDFDGALEPQWGTPELANENIKYLQAGDGDPRSPYRMSGDGAIFPGDNDTPPLGEPDSAYQATSLFILEPGKETQYVTFAGYARNAYSFDEVDIGEDSVFQITHHLERGAFAYGELTANNKVPTSGTGSYQGSMIASMIFNPTLDGQDASGLADLPSYFQWIEGTANIAVDFSRNTFGLDLEGTVLAPQLDYLTGPQDSVIEAGAAFEATAEGSINLGSFGGFKGAFESARFVNPGASGDTRDVAIEGSSVDGAFYGPNGEEIGGGFRIVGGNPDERVDVLGAFVGKK